MSVKAIRVDDLFGDPRAPAGAFKFFAVDGVRAGFNFRCPCGSCEHMGGVRFSPPAANGWTWDGNEEAPTVRPSVLLYAPDGNGGAVAHWHGFLTAGEWESC